MTLSQWGTAQRTDLCKQPADILHRFLNRALETLSNSVELGFTPAICFADHLFLVQLSLDELQVLSDLLESDTQVDGLFASDLELLVTNDQHGHVGFKLGRKRCMLVLDG
jgi:hypothetical protein